MTLSRRDFLGSVTALGFRGTEPDLLLYNGNLITVDASNPRAQAVAIAGGRFLAVGSNDEIRNLATARTKIIDLGQKTVLPGFIDAHTHPAYSGLRHLRCVDCDLRSIADIGKALRERAASTPPGQWVMGFKYDDTKTSDGRKLTREDLDAAAPHHPVYVEHRGGHTAFVNSAAFKAAGVADTAPDPPGGKFDRRDGRLTGELRERATEPFLRLLPMSFTRDERREAAKLISSMMSRTGVTSVHDAEGTPEDLRSYQDAADSGDLRCRVYCFLQYQSLDQMLAAGVRTGFGDEWVRLGGIKLYADGSISERTARLSQPYVGRPDDFGMLVTGEPELYAKARRAHENGWQVGVHANGDVAIDMVLRIYERLAVELPRRDPRFRIEHCTVVNPALIERMRRLGAIPTPFSTYVYYHGEKMREYGPDRVNWMFAVRSFLDAGIPVPETSDYPAGPFPPMMALQSSVTRADRKGAIWGPNQRVTVEEAIRVGTLNGAFASYEEKTKGSIEPGKLADLVVLGRDPTRVDPMSIVDIPVERTMTGGRWVFEA